MTSKVKIILITSFSTILIGGTAFYFLFWRKRKGINPQDVDELKQYKVEQQSVDKKQVAATLSQIPIFI